MALYSTHSVKNVHRRMSSELMLRLCQTNLKGPFSLSIWHCAPWKLASGGGSVDKESFQVGMPEIASFPAGGAQSLNTSSRV
jgi:hypothetical protein